MTPSLLSFPRVLALVVLLGCCGSVNAGPPLISFAPMSRTSIVLPEGGVGTVQYLVTNHSRRSMTLTMPPVEGVTTSKVRPDECSHVFKLGPFGSCLLTLVIGPALIPAASLVGGPIVCATDSPHGVTPNANICYGPAIKDVLVVKFADVKTACDAADGVLVPRTAACWIKEAIPPAPASPRCSVACNARGLLLESPGNSARVAASVCSAFGMGDSPLRDSLGLITFVGSFDRDNPASCTWDDLSGNDWDNPRDMTFAAAGSYFCPCTSLPRPAKH